LILSDRAHDHVARPRNAGAMADADRIGTGGSPGGGPYIQLWLKLDGGRILKATYETNGCPSSIASASALCELITGREIAKVRLLEARDLITYLGGLPEGKEFYADLAVNAVRDGAREDYKA